LKKQLVDWLCCPNCGGELHLNEAREANGEVESGHLTCMGCGHIYPVVSFVPRFVPSENYTSTFGFQWNRFRQTQLDSHSGLPISRERFFRETGWTSDDLTGKKVLDMGCGAGRFAEVALSHGAVVVGVDYSSAVDACWQNLGQHPNLHLIQADIYALPFHPKRFDFVYCLGVLQHTPDVKRAFMVLPTQLRRGGRLAVDLYPKLSGNIHLLWPRYWLRPLTKSMPLSQLFRLVQAMVKFLLPVSILIGRIPLLGCKLRYVIPVANYEGVYPLSRTQLREWAILDTFDMLASTYDQPQSVKTLRGWFFLADFREIEVFRMGLLVGRGVRC